MDKPISQDKLKTVLLKLLDTVEERDLSARHIGEVPAATPILDKLIDQITEGKLDIYIDEDK